MHTRSCVHHFFYPCIAQKKKFQEKELRVELHLQFVKRVSGAPSRSVQGHVHYELHLQFVKKVGGPQGRWVGHWATRSMR